MQDSVRARSFNQPCHCGSHRDRMAAARGHNVCMMRGAYNPHHFWCSASNQRLGAAGVGADSAGAAAPLGGFGFFGLRIVFRAAPLGGGPAGCSSATTGLATTVVDAGVEKSPWIRRTCTGTVAGWHFFFRQLPDKPLTGPPTATPPAPPPPPP